MDWNAKIFPSANDLKPQEGTESVDQLLQKLAIQYQVGMTQIFTFHIQISAALRWKMLNNSISQLM